MGLFGLSGYELSPFTRVSHSVTRRRLVRAQHVPPVGRVEQIRRERVWRKVYNRYRRLGFSDGSCVLAANIYVYGAAYERARNDQRERCD